MSQTNITSPKMSNVQYATDLSHEAHTLNQLHPSPPHTLVNVVADVLGVGEENTVASLVLIVSAGYDAAPPKE